MALIRVNGGGPSGNADIQPFTVEGNSTANRIFGTNFTVGKRYFISWGDSLGTLQNVTGGTVLAYDEDNWSNVTSAHLVYVEATATTMSYAGVSQTQFNGSSVLPLEVTEIA